MKDNKLIIVGNPITSTAQVLAEKLANTHSGEIIVVDKDDKSFKNVVPFEDIVNVFLILEECTGMLLIYLNLLDIKDMMLYLLGQHQRFLEIPLALVVVELKQRNANVTNQN
jgi:hypothetical protein